MFRMSRFLLSLVVFIAAGCLPAGAAVNARYVYFGNALSEAMELSEFQVWSGRENIIRNRPEVFTQGLEYSWYMHERTPEWRQRDARMLVDGKLDPSQRVSFGSKVGGGYLDITLRYTSLQLDLGQEVPIDSVAFQRSRYTGKVHNDLGWRILAVLDEQRRIVGTAAFTVYDDQWKKNNGVRRVELQAPPKAWAGRVIPAGTRCWVSEAEFIRDFLGKPVVDVVQQMSPADQARLDRFKRRNTPEAIAALGRRFFRLVDLDRPGLEKVKTLVSESNYGEALDAFKEPFLARLEPLKDWNAGEGTSIYVFYSWTTEPDTRYTGRSRDLRNHVYGDRDALVVKRFVPGLLPPAKFGFPFQMRPLLLNYAVSGDPEDLRLWEAMTDDWAMGFQDAAGKHPSRLRDYFVLDPGLKANLKDLYMAARSNPNFAPELSGATLARFLMPILEEIPVASWRVLRHCNFNHTFNAVPSGLFTAGMLDEFHAGQRWYREMRQAFQRQYTLSQYRDGSMVEIGDEGHYLASVISPANLYGWYANCGRPPWFTPALETYFLDNYRANMLSHVRNIAPCGAHVRWNGDNDRLLFLEYELGIKDPYWRNVTGMRMQWGDYYDMLTVPILKEPMPRAIVDTVYGRGRAPFEDSNKRREQEQVAQVYGTNYQGPPSIVSDWMPYTGLWYFRGGWDHEASFLHMARPANANNNGGAILYPLTSRYGKGQFNDTTYRFYDYATPLVTGLGVLIDGLPPCPGELRTPSGSKQDTFTQAIAKPQPARWYTDAQLDFGEAIYQGDYREVGLRWNNKLHQNQAYVGPDKVADVTTHRQIFQIRPARLFLQVDRLRYGDTGAHTNRIEDTVILTSPPDGTDDWKPNEQIRVAGNRYETRNPDNPGLTVARYGQPGLTVRAGTESMRHGSFPEYGRSITQNGYRSTTGRLITSTWTGRDETVLLSVLRAAEAAAEPIQFMEDLSNASRVGVRVVMSNGVSVALVVARHVSTELSVGKVRIKGESLLLVQQPGAAPYGIVLGGSSFNLNGENRELAAANVAFALAETLQQSPVQRPIDPPTIGPSVNVFTDETTVTITSKTPDIEIYYLTEALDEPARRDKLSGLAGTSDKATNWQRYEKPFRISESTFVRARAQRKGVTDVPVTSAGTAVSAISYGFFHQKPMKRAANLAADEVLRPGLEYDYLEDRWFALWTYTDQLDAVSTGVTDRLLDVSMRKTNGPFGVRYHGYIDVPADGMYTFYGPDEYVNNFCAPGYDLRVFVDGEQWDLTQIWHGRGTWSMPLAKGLHTFRVTFADARAKDLENQPIDLWGHYPWAETTWRGVVPVVELSGPGLDRQPIPTGWLKHGSQRIKQ